MKILKFLFLAAALLSGPDYSMAQNDFSQYYQRMDWRNVGPNRGGRSIAVAGSPGRKLEYYFGATGGGLWKTTDGGQTWGPVTDGQLKSSSVGAVAIAETNPDIIYIGMGETELRGNVMQGDGVYKSTDGGENWRHMGLSETQVISKIRVHPTNPDIVYVAAFGDPYKDNPERGVYKSTDGGITWKPIFHKSPKAGAIELILDRSNPEVIYCSFWQVYRTPWKMWGGGPDCTLYKSSDGGESWTELTQNPGMPAPPIGKIGIAVSPSNPNRVWAQVEANEGGLFRSEDGGSSWKRVNKDRRVRQRAFYYSRIYSDPFDNDVVYGLNTGFFKSTTAGDTFDIELKTDHGDYHDLWIDPNDPERMIVATDGGGTVSVNGGETWTTMNFPTAQLYHIMTTNDFPYFVCGAQQDNTTMCIPSEGWNFKTTWGPSQEYYYAVGGGESGYIAQDPKDLDIFYAGSQGALLTVYNRQNGFKRDVQVYPRFFSGDPAEDLPERWQWTFPIVFSPVDNNRLYTCSQHVWYSVDGGQSWNKISPDLTLAEPETLGKTGGLITMDMNGPEIYATVFALAPSYHDVNTIWAGSDDGLVHITRDHGQHWDNITPPDMPKHTRVSIIEASRHNPGTAYIAGKRYQMGDRAPYLWKTSDYGKTWTKIINGIRSDDFLHTIREDIYQPGLLFAGGEHGVWVSTDDGATWASLQLNMPDTQISDLSVTEKDLVAGTHGRSVYILDDIGPIRDAARAQNTDAYLFKPYYGVRREQNVVIQYNLKNAVDSVTIEILDEQGSVIRTIGGSEPENEKQESDPMDFWYGTKIGPPTTGTGINRWEWNLRHQGATSFEGMIIWSAKPEDGPHALPGDYQVKVQFHDASGTKEQTQPFEIRMDPRKAGVNIGDIEKQFQLAMEIMQATSSANQAVIQIRDIKDQILLVTDGSNDKGLAKQANQLENELSNVEENLYQVRNQSNQDPLNFPIKLNNRLAYLRKSVESGDGLPTAGAYQVFEELKADLDLQLQTLETITNQDLSKFNADLSKKGLQQIKVN